MLRRVKEQQPQTQHAHKFSKLGLPFPRKRAHQYTRTPRRKSGVTNQRRTDTVPKYSPTSAAIGHRMNLTLFEETSIGGIRVPEDLVREEKRGGRRRLGFGHNSNV